MSNFKALLLVTTLGVAVLAAGCTSASEAYCARKAECNAKDCKGTDAACEELQTGDEESCIADKDAELEAVRSGDSAVCDECADNVEAMYDCLGAIESCDKFDTGASSDGECASEANKVSDSCGDVESVCLGYK